MDTSSRLTLRIFISSPGDLPVERDCAADVIARLRPPIRLPDRALNSYINGRCVDRQLQGKASRITILPVESKSCSAAN